MWSLLALLLAAGPTQGTVVLDRVAVAVVRRPVKLSDIDGELRVSAFLNRQALNLSPKAKREAADRLVDQQLIREEMANGGYQSVTVEEADRVITDLRRDRFVSSDQKFLSELKRYGLTQEQLRQGLQWQLTVLRFIDQRFRPGVLITDEEVQAFYDSHKTELRREYPKDSSLKTLEPKIRQSLEGERINQSLDEWLKQMRQRTRIQYHEEAFRDQPG